jgi:hypothetical protein
MKIDVHRLRLHPCRMTQLKRHENQLSGEHRRQMQALGNMLLNRLVKASLEARRQFGKSH